MTPPVCYSHAHLIVFLSVRLALVRTTPAVDQRCRWVRLRTRPAVGAGARFGGNQRRVAARAGHAIGVRDQVVHRVRVHHRSPPRASRPGRGRRYSHTAGTASRRRSRRRTRTHTRDIGRRLAVPDAVYQPSRPPAVSQTLSGSSSPSRSPVSAICRQYAAAASAAVVPCPSTSTPVWVARHPSPCDSRTIVVQRRRCRRGTTSSGFVDSDTPRSPAERSLAYSLTVISPTSDPGTKVVSRVPAVKVKVVSVRISRLSLAILTAGPPVKVVGSELESNRTCLYGLLSRCTGTR